MHEGGSSETEKCAVESCGEKTKEANTTEVISRLKKMISSVTARNGTTDI